MNPLFLAALVGGGVLGAGALVDRLFRPRPPSGVLARIVAPGVDYRTTAEDWLWLARACACEKGGVGPDGGRWEYPWLAWAMIQRFVAFRQGGRAGSGSMAQLVRAFSQPVNPHWINGTGPAAGLIEAGDERMSPENLAHRRECSARDWAWFEAHEPALADLIARFAQGTPPAPPFPRGWEHANDFASGPAMFRRDDGYDPLGDGRGNVYLNDHPAFTGTVRVIP